MSRIICIMLVYFQIGGGLLAMDEEKIAKVEKKCRQRHRLIASDKGDLYTVVDATFNEKLILQCNYCNENDDARPKNWYKIRVPGTTMPHPVNISMENDIKLNRIHLNAEHSLIIHNFTGNDVGLYYCKGFEEQNKFEKHNYLVDLIADENATSDIETGNMTMWKKYYDEYFLPINNMLSSSEGEEFHFVREELKLKMELVTSWDPWGVCEVCGRPQGRAIKRKTGFCRIKLTPQFSPSVNKNLSENYVYLLSVTAISCKSKRLGRVLPQISNLTKVIPNFIQTQSCEGSCNPDAENANGGWKVGKTKGYKYRKTVVLNEDDYLTLVCPESTLENTTIWRKNSKKLPAGQAVVPENPEEEPRIFVDTFNSLYLAKVKRTEEGNYTCQVDDVKMQQIRVFIVAKSYLLSHLFVRHLMYLGFVLGLTSTCYCAGVIISCHRRSSFKTRSEIIEDIRRKRKEKGERIESEELLLL